MKETEAEEDKVTMLNSLASQNEGISVMGRRKRVMVILFRMAMTSMQIIS